MKQVHIANHHWWPQSLLRLTCIIAILFGAIFSLTMTAQATNHIVRLNEIMAGANGDSNIQFVEMEISGGQNLWGPRGSETVGRAQLIFFDTNGRQTGRFVFPENAPAVPPGSSSVSVLIATQAFADLAGAPTPDFIMPPEIRALRGKVCFDDNFDENSNAFTLIGNGLCVSYGGADYNGNTEGAGPAVAGDLTIINTVSVQRSDNFNAFGGVNNNSDFQLSSVPNPTNAAGDTFTMDVLSTVDQGSKLYFDETFEGNGRTCGNCHFADDELSISPDRVTDMLANDPMNPLFIANFNLNTLTLNAASTPSDLRGDITDSNGLKVFLLNGTEDTYLVYGGLGLSGTVTDENGNSGTVASVTAGDLNNLENHNLMTSGRLLFLENPDGFANPPVFQESLHNLNLNTTAPFGHRSGESNLRVFAAGAVGQHNPLTLARVTIANGGTDFRDATSQELAMMETFMFSVQFPKDQNFNLDNVITTLAQKQGRVLYEGDAKCSACHGGSSLAVNESFAGRAEGLNDHFDTGVTDLPINSSLLGNADIQDGQAFNTPSLWGIRFTDPYFHDNAIDNLRDAILFYDSSAFRNSPAFGEIGTLETVAISQNTDDILAFLEALVSLPVDYTRALVFTDRIVNSGPSAVQSVNLTNIMTDVSPSVLTIDSVSVLNVSDRTPSTAYAVAGSPAGQTINGGNNTTINVTFSPDITGTIEASLEIVLIDSDGVDYSIGVELTGNGIPDPVVEPGTPTPVPLPEYVIQSIVPNQGNNNRIRSVRLTGEGFLDSPTVVLFNGESGVIELSNVGYINDTQITVNVPAGLQPGQYFIRTVNPSPDHRSAVSVVTYEVLQLKPTIEKIIPEQGIADQDNLISVYGSGFDEGALVKIGDYIFTTQQINSGLLNVNVPADLPVGDYNVRVLNQNGRKSERIRKGYTVLAGGVDDLWATDDVDLWIGEKTVRNGKEIEIGLVVHRTGGKKALLELPVDFYEGDQNGTYIGRGVVNLPIREANQSTTAVLWTPTITGTQTLYAVIDPDNDHPDETRKDNNNIIRTVGVLPPPVSDDVLAPRVGYFQINEGQDMTDSQVISLTVTVSDENQGTNSGVHQVYFAEYNFNQNAAVWVLRQTSGWLDGSPTQDITFTNTYSWTMLPSPGQTIIHAWASDGERNISAFPNEQDIAYWAPDSAEEVNANQSRFYAVDLAVGDRLDVLLTPIKVGDPDLFIWPPLNLPGVPPYVSNKKGQDIDQVAFTVPDGEAGTYVIDIYGYTYANYKLVIDRPVAGFQNVQAATSLSRRLRPLNLDSIDELTFVNQDKPDRTAEGVPQAFRDGPDNSVSPVELPDIPTIMPEPTETPVPTETPIPDTPVPTETPIPDTPVPTETPIPDTPKPTVTPTPVPTEVTGTGFKSKLYLPTIKN